MPRIKDVKERSLISLITDVLEEGQGFDEPSTRPFVGPGRDDCAVMDTGGGQLLVATTDMLHRKADFPSGMTAWQMGWMSVAVNLSDIAAMGAVPIGVMAALGMPHETEINFVKELVEGMNACVRQHGTCIIGGDVDRHDELTITGSALGLVEREHLALRSGARPGDLVCVTGETGAAGAALDYLLQGKNPFPYVVRKLYLPVPRVREGAALAGIGCLTSMMDISDGLALSLHDIAAASGVGIHIKADDIPVHKTVREMAGDEEQLVEWSVYSGGDFELLFTLGADCVKSARKAARFTVIGEVRGSGVTIERDGRTEDVQQRGYQQFGG